MLDRYIELVRGRAGAWELSARAWEEVGDTEFAWRARELSGELLTVADLLERAAEGTKE